MIEQEKRRNGGKTPGLLILARPFSTPFLRSSCSMLLSS